MKFLSGFVAAILLAFIGGVALIYSGAYNVAADREHIRIAKWILGTAMTNSVKAHADAAMPPAGFDANEHVREGFRLFDEMCVQCHGAPGKQPGEVGQGLRPEPPELSEVVRRWSPAQLFWIVKHGIIATGMPAFGSTHTERELWDLVAFVRKLPGMSPGEYKAFAQGAGAPHEHGPHEHQHGH
jgi:mono/diheme cytochrome c family protein